jgi:hypothetical protein
MSTPIGRLSRAMLEITPEDLAQTDPVALWKIREMAGQLVAICDREMLARSASSIKVDEEDAA